MRIRTWAIGGAIGAAAIAMTASLAQAPADLNAVPAVPTGFTPKKTAWGEPDLRGTWPIDHLNGTPLERDPKYGTRVFMNDAEYAARAKQAEAAQSRYEAEDKSGKMGMGHWAEMGEASRRTSFIISPADGRLPAMTDEGKARSAAMKSSWRRGQLFDTPTDFDSWDRCITRGMPASMFPFQYNNGMRVFQSPGVVAIQMEMIHETRIIPTDGRAPLPGKILNWLGESRGHWEKNVLVVETGNLKAGPSVTNVGTIGSPPENDRPISPQAKIVERFTMTGPDSIVYEMTYSDPVVFTAPFTARLDWKRDPNYGIFEYACHEGNVQIRNYITASRAQRAEGEKK